MASNFDCNYSKKNTVNVNVLNNVCIYFLLCVLFGFLYDIRWKCILSFITSQYVVTCQLKLMEIFKHCQIM